MDLDEKLKIKYATLPQLKSLIDMDSVSDMAINTIITIGVPEYLASVADALETIGMTEAVTEKETKRLDYISGQLLALKRGYEDPTINGEQE
jgi:hypothetical protein